MRFSFKKILFQLLGFELFGKELLRIAVRGLQSCQVSIRQRLFTLALKVFVGLLVLGLVYMMFFFGMAALALYLNEMLSSSYLGFLMVAVVCAGLLSLLLLYQAGRWRQW